MTRLQALLSTLPPITLPAPPTPLQEFTLFPRLPAEMRNKIWKHATQVSRKVKIFELNTVSTHKGWDSRVEGQTWIPGIMQACRESRYEGGKVYKLCYEKPQPSREGGTENDGQPEQASAPLTASGAHLYINFDRDLFVMVPHDPVSDTYEAALAVRPPQRNTISKGGDNHTLHPEDLKNMQHFEHTFQNRTPTDVGFLIVAPIREYTLAFRHHAVKDGDNVDGDLVRCKVHCEFERRLRKILGQRVKVPDFLFHNRWLRGYGQDLDPARSLVINTPCLINDRTRICLENAE
ncbi:hypothetical protein ACEPPN_006450 [Leptodophora sp. 'Broadleaf-Isolate-01']